MIMTLMEDRYICLVRASADVVALDGTDTVDGMLARAAVHTYSFVTTTSYMLTEYTYISRVPA